LRSKLIYPNSTRGAFVEELPLAAGDAPLELINSLGQTVQVQQVHPSPEARQESFQLASSLALGLYTVRLGWGR
jgi:hypothetical protein